MENKKKRKFINCPVIIFAENPIEIKKKAKISFLLEILLKMKNEKMKKKVRFSTGMRFRQTE